MSKADILTACHGIKDGQEVIAGRHGEIFPAIVRVVGVGKDQKLFICTDQYSVNGCHPTDGRIFGKRYSFFTSPAAKRLEGLDYLVLVDKPLHKQDLHHKPIANHNIHVGALVKSYASTHKAKVLAICGPVVHLSRRCPGNVNSSIRHKEYGSTLTKDDLIRLKYRIYTP